MNRGVFRWLAAILFLAVVVQVGLAGYGAFHAVHAAKHTAISQKTINNAFDPHIALGHIIVLVMLVLIVVALAGRLGKRSVGWAGGILLLGIAQAILGMASESVPRSGRFTHSTRWRSSPQPGCSRTARGRTRAGEGTRTPDLSLTRRQVGAAESARSACKQAGFQTWPNRQFRLI